MVNNNVLKMGIGSVNFGMDYGTSPKLDYNSIKTIMHIANKNNIRLLDTAHNYGNSEKNIGRYINDTCESFIISTKCKKIELGDDSRLIIMDSLNKSLKNLNIKNIDYFFMHQEDKYILSDTNFWLTINEIKRKGLIKNFGFSVYDLENTIDLLLKHGDKIDSIQVPLSIFDQRFSTLREITKEKKIYVIARSVFMRGYLTCDIKSLPKGLNEVRKKRKALESIAIKNEVTPLHLALDFVLKEKFIDKFIVGVNSSYELLELIKIIKTTKELNIDYNQFRINEANELDLRKW
jgi:aryl-alcohol dehydrogenase-like predicted oxidoreductase